MVDLGLQDIVKKIRLRYGFRTLFPHGVPGKNFPNNFSRRKLQMKIGKRRFATQRRSVMTVTYYRAVTATLGAAVVGMLLVPPASACALGDQPGPFAVQQLLPDVQNPMAMATFSSLARDQSSASSATSASIVGMWSFQLISEGNTTRNPPIADGAQLNFGYIQLHSDETEIQNSGARSPAQQNFCLGVWQKTGRYTYQVNHYALNYNASTGALLGRIILIETLTLSPGGTAFSGTFVETVYDTMGNKTDHLTGQITAQRMTVDTTTP
jgi:hypothetical protein